MPTYEYRCPGGHEFEKFFRSISAAAGEHPCPSCGAVGVRQLSGGAGLMFKGSGFYLTDYGKNAHANRGSAPKAGGEAAAPSEGAPPATEGSGASASQQRDGSAGDAAKGTTGSEGTSANKPAGKPAAAAPAAKPKSTE